MKIKTPNELDNQLTGVESFIEQKIEPKNTREELLSLSLDEIKNRYPREYRTYFSVLKTEAKLLHFPDMPTEQEKPKINLLKTGARDCAFKINFSDSSHVIKPLESLAEKDIAEKASSLGIGPKQFKTNEGYLHEEFIDGTPLLSIEDKKCTPEYMKNLGTNFIQALKKCHENDILINDQILTDDFGKSHMIIDENENVRFIDFGASIDIKDFPNISDEAVMSLMRTDPFMAFRIGKITNTTEEEIKEEINGYRENILSQYKTKEDIINMKDIQLLNEGLYFLQNRIPNVQFFIQGVKEQF